MREVPSITLPRIHSEAIEINSHRNPPTFFSRFAPSCFQKEVSSPEIPVQGLLALNQRENLIAFSSSQCILVYNLSTLQALEISVSHESMQSGIYSMCWTKDGRSLLIGTATGICITRFTRSNSLQEFDSVMFSLCEQQGPIKVLQAAPCGRFFASSTRGASSVAVWDCLLLTGRSIECFPTKSLITFEWTPDGENLITFSR